MNKLWGAILIFCGLFLVLHAGLAGLGAFLAILVICGLAAFAA